MSSKKAYFSSHIGNVPVATQNMLSEGAMDISTQ